MNIRPMMRSPDPPAHLLPARRLGRTGIALGLNSLFLI